MINYETHQCIEISFPLRLAAKIGIIIHLDQFEI